MMQSNFSSGNLTADRRADYARMLDESGDFQAAAELMLQAMELAPDWTAGWFQAGGYFEKAGNAERAINAFDRVLEASPVDKFGARLKLALLRGGSVEAPQTAYVEALFDDYAEKFDRSLVEKLEYRVPQLLSEMVGKHSPSRTFEHCIDLGCGTGLMAQALGRKASSFTGIDLSAAMLGRADEKKLYAKLIKADLIEGTAAAGPADLIIAADVFMYLGSLLPVMETVAEHLPQDGLFAFSVEKFDAVDGYKLRPSLRHAHSETYLVQNLANAGLVPLEIRTETIRMDGPDAIQGLLTVARKSDERMNADG
jgi:predicted TPR repeat methyltransferase